MGLTNYMAKLFLNSSDLLKPEDNRSESKWLSVGTVDYWIDFKLLKKYGFTYNLQNKLFQNIERNTTAWHDACKELCRIFFTHFGFKIYLELDINKRADIRIDLNNSIPDDLREKFDLVFDAGSVEHVMNVCQAMQNLVDIVKVGGKFVHTQFIGDQTNHGYWTISPNYYLDF